MVAVSNAAPESNGDLVEPSPSNKSLSLGILADVTTSQSSHGLKHSDYARYRAYCTRRLARLRSATATSNKQVTQNHRYAQHVITSEDALANPRALVIPLVQAERDWAFAMDVKRTQPAGPARARRRVHAKLTRAVQHSATLSALCRQVADETTVLEAEAYASAMQAALALEREQWSSALAAFELAHKIYAGMAGVRTGTSAAALFERRVEDVAQAMRFCRYNLARSGGGEDDVNGANGDAALLQGLRAGSDAAMSSDLIAEKIEAALAEARRRAAVSFGNVEWCGVEIALRSERVREAVLTAEEEGAAFEKREAVADDYDKLFLVLNDAVKVVNDELAQFRASESAGGDRVRELELLVAYLTHKRLKHTVSRNLLLVEALRTRRGAKPEDFVRLFDNLIGNMSDVLALPGVEEDASMSNEAEGRRKVFQMRRCFHLAQCYQAAGLQTEAAALFDRVGTHAGTMSGKYSNEARAIVAESAGMKCRARAEAFLEMQEVNHGMATLDVKGHEHGRKTMVEHMEEMASFVGSGDNGRVVCEMPPALEAVPCKPVLFDLGIDGVRPPEECGPVESGLSEEKQEVEKPVVEPSATSTFSSTRLGRWWSGKS